jgi:uncharacterized damage-inducible protein DinB
MLPRLIEHMAWADHRVADSIATLIDPDIELVNLFAHVLGAEAAWLARLAGTTSDVSIWPELDLDGCRELAARNHAAFQLLLLDDAALARAVTYVNSRGDSYTNTVDEILHHVCLHGMHHRGQVIRAVRQAGGQPRPTDFIAFVRGH